MALWQQKFPVSVLAEIYVSLTALHIEYFDGYAVLEVGTAYARLETVSAQPKSIKLECQRKCVAPGESTYVDIMIADKEGRTVPFAAREIEVSVLEEGSLVCVGTADPSGTRNPAPGICTVYDGRAVAVVRGTQAGKMVVKVTGEGLLSNKITVKVK